MNDYYYYTILCEYIDIKDRIMCSRRDRHIIAKKREKYKLLLADIYVHLGTPCDRYCICKYFDKQDFIIVYEEYVDENNNNKTHKQMCKSNEN